MIKHAAFFLAVAASASAYGGTATGTMTITATVDTSCVVSASPLAFGTYDPISANASSPLFGSSSLNLRCTQGAYATIDLDQGLNPASGSTAAAPLRQLAVGTGRLSYFLYTDSAHTTAWGQARQPVTIRAPARATPR